MKAVELVQEYYKRYNEIPNQSLLREYFCIFQKPNERLIDEFDKVHELQGDKGFTLKIYKDTSPLFEDYEAFLEYCGVKNKFKEGNF